MIGQVLRNLRYRFAERGRFDEPVHDGRRRVLEKPTVKLVGENGNVFNVIGLTKRALRAAGRHDLADEFLAKAFKAGSYDEVLRLVMQYCEVE